MHAEQDSPCSVLLTNLTNLTNTSSTTPHITLFGYNAVIGR
jgi:hypothetical protein